MKERTDEEITAKLREIWPNASAYDWGSQTPGILVQRRADGILLTVGSMYGWDDQPRLDFQKLNAVAQFFDTLNVETESEFNNDGCETCNYGGAHGFVLLVRPGDPVPSNQDGVAK